MSQIVTCPNCGQKNRINEVTDGAQPICAKCWTRLDVPTQKVRSPPPAPKEPIARPRESTKTKKQAHGASYSWLWFLVLGGFLWWLNAQNSDNSNRTQTATRPTQSTPAPNYPEVALPNSGATQVYSNGERVAPLEIQTSQGANYLVKLVSAQSQQAIMTIFVRGGNTITTKVPLGTYEIRYASGETWYGYEYLFGQNTGYSKAESRFTFADTGRGYSGFTITLYRVSNGNLRTSSIAPSQF